MGELLTRKEAAEYLKCSIRTLIKYRKAGLRYVQFSARQIRYRREDLEAWAKRHAQQEGNDESGD